MNLPRYIPVDSSGDWFYQAMDACSLLCVLYLLYARFSNSQFEGVAEEMISIHALRRATQYVVMSFVLEAWSSQ